MWGAATFIISAYADESRTWLIRAGLFFLGVAILEENVFEGHTWRTKVFGYSALLVLLYIGSRYIPPPPEPLTAKSIGDELDKRIQDAHGGITTLMNRKEPVPPTPSSLTAPAVVDEVFKRLQANGLAIPPISNSELRQEVFAYTKGLRDMGQRRFQAFGASAMMAPASRLPDAGEKQRVYFNIDRQIETEFLTNYKDKGIALRKTLLSRLNIPGPPTPNILDGVPIEPLDIRRVDVYQELADYLDGLAKQLLYP